MVESKNRILSKISITLALSLFLFALFVGFSTSIACAAVLKVTNTDNDGAGSLRTAITSAVTGDVISFDVEGKITLISALEIRKGITIEGPGAEKLEINGNDATSIFYIDKTTEPLTISGISIVNGKAIGVLGTYGGGMQIYYSEKVKIEDCIFSVNSAPSNGWGGAIYIYQSSPTFVECTFNKNSAKGGGGAIFNFDSSPKFIDCTFEENTGESGGAMYNNFQNVPIPDPTEITGCTFKGNLCNTGYGGAVSNYSEGIVNIINSTFFENSASRGGAIHNYKSSPSIMNCTFAKNTASDGDGIANEINSSPVVTNCIFWDKNSDEIFNSSGTPKLNYCVVKDNKVGTGTIIDNVITGDPVLGSLKDNGGATETCALGTGSSAIDSGTDSGAPPADQRGVSRPQGSRVDIGAYEAPPQPAPTPGSSGGCQAASPAHALWLMLPLGLALLRRRN